MGFMSELAVKLSGPTLETTGANAGRACIVIEVTDAGTHLAADELVREIKKLDTIRTYRVVVTGAKAAARWTDVFAVPLRRAGFRIALECDATCAPEGAIDWLAVTPRRAARFADVHPDEVRVIADATCDVHELDGHAARWRCDHYLMIPRTREDLPRCLALIAARPRWRLVLDLRDVPAKLPAAIGSPQRDVQPGAEAETTLLA
jgi:hypothetical protein